MNAAAGGWESWSWDESLFAGAAGYYEQGRLPYAPGPADVFARSLALDGRGTDMREILAQASPPGRFCVRLPGNILRIWRLQALSGTGPSRKVLRPGRPTAAPGKGT